jgi:hypothetical protein
MFHHLSPVTVEILVIADVDAYACMYVCKCDVHTKAQAQWLYSQCSSCCVLDLIGAYCFIVKVELNGGTWRRWWGGVTREPVLA